MKEGHVTTSPSARLVLFMSVLVALCAAIATGSCSAMGNGDGISDGDKTVAGAILLPALFSGGLALTVGLLYLPRVARRSGAHIFSAVGVMAYIAGMAGAWYPLLYHAVLYFADWEGIPWAGPYFLGAIALMVFGAGGLIAGCVARDGIVRFSCLTALVSGIAIAAAATGFIAGFWTNMT